MSSPEKEKHLAVLASLEAFCEAHNEKTKLVEKYKLFYLNATSAIYGTHCEI